MTIDNSMDVIDSRDIIERIEELEMILEDDFNDDTLASEYKSLLALAEQCEGIDDWEYGASLIRDSYFTEYCRELVIDCGDIPANLPWYINRNIDWVGIAREIAMDYTEVDFNGVTYFVR